jgi:hypothetical protein
MLKLPGASRKGFCAKMLCTACTNIPNFRLTPLLWALSGALAMGAEEKIKQNHDNKNIISKNHDK